MSEWHQIKDGLPDVKYGVYLVKTQNGIEKDAFFYQDKISWIAFYGMKTSHWWNAKGKHERLDDITHWRVKG